MDLQLSGKTVLVTGASKGIGLATAMAFAREGAAISMVARERENGKRVGDDDAQVGKVSFDQCDYYILHRHDSRYLRKMAPYLKDGLAAN